MPHTADNKLWTSDVIVEFADEHRAVAFEEYLKSGSRCAFAQRHFRSERWQPLPFTPAFTSMDLHIPPELEAKLNQIAAETGRTADQVALELLGGSVGSAPTSRSSVNRRKT